MVGQPARVGRGLRTIAINLSKMAKESATFEAANGKVNISLQKENGEMRSTYEILQQLGEVWGTLNETEQTSIATTIAGKTQFETFANIMKNWGTAAKVVDEATKANGSSLKENEKYLDSIEGKIQAFQSAWEQLSYHLVNSDLIKNVVEIGTKIITTIDKIVQSMGALPTAIGLVVGAFGALKLAKLTTGFLGFSEAVGGFANSKAFSLLAKELTSWINTGSIFATMLPGITAGLIALGGAFIYANYQYKNSFKGKLEEYKELGNKIEDIKSQIEALEGKEGELTSEEQSRLSILKMQLQVLQQQEALKSKQLTHAFDKDAKEKMHGKTHMEQGEKITEREDTVGEKYLKAAEKRFELQKKIKHLEDESRMHPLTEEQTKDLEKYNKELDKVYDNEYDALDKLIEAEKELANVDYSKLSSDGKAYYDNIHSAYVQATSDIEEVRNAVGQTIDLFGSAQFDSWDIDVSSLKSASELADQITAKISKLDDEEDITIYARDETGNIIDEITRKKGDLTDEEWELVVNATTTGDYEELAKYAEGGTSENNEVLISFIPIGLGEIESEKGEATSDAVSILTYNDNGTIGQIQVSKIQAIDPAKGTITFDDNGTTKTIKTDKIDAAKNVSGSITFTSNIGSILSNIRAAIAEKSKLAGHAKGKRKGEEGGLSWLGDEGTASNPKPELVVGEDGAYLAGTSGWELHSLKDSDTVYSYSETKKLLGGRQSFTGSVEELPRYKKGKKKKAKKQTKQQKRKAVQKKASKKTKQKWEKEFDKKLKDLQYKAKVNHWTDAKYQAEYKKLYNKYYNKATTAQLREYVESREDYENEVALKDFDRRLGNLAVRGAGETRLANFVKDVKASTDLSADEKKEQLEKAYKNVAEYNLKAYENGKATRDKTLQSINDYYKQVGKKDEDYYKMLDDLREADQKKEVERLKKLEEQEENKLSLAQKYLNKELKAIEKQIDAQKEEKEAQEKLVELQNELNKAKSTSIRIYKEGVGFVYEQDTEAIKEAQKAYDDYLDSQNKTDLEKRAEEIRAVLELFGDLEDASEIHELELKLGVNGINSLTGGNFGTNISQWTSWIKSVIANQVAYADLGNKIGDLKGADIDKWLGNVLSGGAHQVSSSTMLSYILQHSFASGTLSAPGGLSRINELGGELVWLGKGDSVYSNRVSRNLMEWGRYNPAQVLSSNHNSSSSQIFNFDKIVLPNVRNAEDFYRELQKLPNMAIQQSARR